MSGLSTGDPSKEFGHRHRECGGKAIDVHEARISAASLDVAEVGAVDASLGRQFVLGQLEFLAAVPDRESKTVTDVGSLGFAHSGTITCCRR